MKFVDKMIDKLKDLFEFEHEFTDNIGFVTQKIYAKSMIITYVVFLIIMGMLGNAKGIGGFWGLLLVVAIFGSVWFFSCKYPVGEIFLNSMVGYFLANTMFSVFKTVMMQNTDGSTSSNAVKSLSDDGSPISKGSGGSEGDLPMLGIVLGTVILSLVFGYLKDYREHLRELRKEELTIPEEEYHKKAMKISVLGTIIVSTVLSFFINDSLTLGQSIGNLVMVVLFVLAFNIVTRIFSGEIAQERRDMKRRKDNMKEEQREYEKNERARKKVSKNKSRGGDH